VSAEVREIRRCLHRVMAALQSGNEELAVELVTQHDAPHELALEAARRLVEASKASVPSCDPYEEWYRWNGAWR
jgi:phage shock protein A